MDLSEAGGGGPYHHPPVIPGGFIMICYCSTLMKLDIEKRDWSCAK